MTSAVVLASLDLPREARVDQRIAKKLLIENGAPTASDKRQINEGIEELIWVAALKPNTVGIPEYRDTVREVLEVAVLYLKLHAGAKASRIVELIHRAIPYPLFLVAYTDGKVVLSLATKRWAQNVGGKTVLDEEPLSVEVEDDSRGMSFLSTLSLRGQNRLNLYEFYAGWKALFEAYLASAYSGRFKQSISPEDAERRRKALDSANAIQRELVVLRAKAERETQMNRKVQLNLDIKRLEQDLLLATKEMS